MEHTPEPTPVPEREPQTAEAAPLQAALIQLLVCKQGEHTTNGEGATRRKSLKKLKGSKNEYRLRVGNYRVLFELEGKRIVVYTVGPRKDIYQ